MYQTNAGQYLRLARNKAQLTSWDKEEDSVRQEPKNLHPLATIELMVDEKSGHVVSEHLDTDVEQVPVPGRDDVARSVRVDDLDESRGEELVPVEKEIVEEPTSGGTE